MHRTRIHYSTSLLPPPNFGSILEKARLLYSPRLFVHLLLRVTTAPPLLSGSCLVDLSFPHNCVPWERYTRRPSHKPLPLPPVEIPISPRRKLLIGAIIQNV